jgi:hypothetical protein
VDTGYTGKPFGFLVAADVLTKFSSKAASCVIGERMVEIDTGEFIWVACLEEM